jgi:hypothetical protein
MRYGTIYDRAGKKAILHRVPEAEFATLCGVSLLNSMPTMWSERARWGLEPKAKQDRRRCKKCYPKSRRSRQWA